MDMNLDVRQTVSALELLSQCPSPQMQKVVQRVKRAVRAKKVLVLGPTGSGKGLVAKAIYEGTERRGPFVEVSCATIPEGLAESELFGHEKGAFTNAFVQHIGCFERATDEVLFLDEFDTLTPALQVKLLRVLNGDLFQRVGGVKPIAPNFSVVAATNGSLEQFVRDGTLREDLYYRVKTFTITVPPLRDRIEDVPYLARHFAEKLQGTPVAIDEQALRLLQDHEWNGNVRELESAIESALHMMDEGETVLLPKHLEQLEQSGCPESLGTTKTVVSPEETLLAILEGKTFAEAIKFVERTLIVGALKRYEGKVVPAAKLLHIHRKSISDRLRRWGDEGQSVEITKTW